MSLRTGALDSARRLFICLRVLAVTGVLGPVVVHCGGSLPEDEFDCEEAAAKIRECCPGVSVDQLACTYRTYPAAGGCNSTTYDPDLTITESTCIVGSTCTQMTAGICDRIAERINTYGVGGSDGGSGAFPTTMVCP